MFEELSRMIDEEVGLDASANRKALLKTMADARGNLAAAVAQLRMFLLTGDASSKTQFDTLFGNFAKAADALAQQQQMLSKTQAESFGKIAKARSEFSPITDRLFQIRSSDQWNAPVHILVTEAAPRANKILDLLEGPKNSAGKRIGGLKGNQQAMLKQDSDKINSDMSFLGMVEWALLAAGLALAGLISFLSARSIAVPMRRMVEAMKKLAAGDFNVVLPGLGRKDEVGDMASAVENFKLAAIAKAQQEAREREEADHKLAAERKAAMHQLADQFETAVGNIIETVSAASTELEASANSLNHTADGTQHRASIVAAASEEASANVQSVAGAAEELSASVAEIARQVQESSMIANQAVLQASSTNEQVQQLSQSATRIGDVVKLITAIADQTNLLALNATIEAARAGEAGKGFAVVASEVKTLAAHTSKATGDIIAQISEIQGATEISVNAIREIGGTIGRIAEISSMIAAAVEEQGAATNEIANNVQQAAEGTGQVASNIVEVNKGAAETGAASNELLASAQELSKQNAHLRNEVDRFLATVRAA